MALLVVLNEAPTPSDPEDFERVQDLLETSSLIDLNLSLMILFYFWQGMLLTFDIEHTRGVTCREAAIVASIPVITSVGWSISRLV